MCEILLKFIIQLKHVWKIEIIVKMRVECLLKLIDKIEIGWHMSGITKTCVNVNYFQTIENCVKCLWNVFDNWNNENIHENGFGKVLKWLKYDHFYFYVWISMNCIAILCGTLKSHYNEYLLNMEMLNPKRNMYHF